MKTLLIVLSLTFTTIIHSQTDTSQIEKRFSIAEYNIDLAGRCLQDAAGGFNRAVLFPVLGYLTSGILAATLDKTKEGNISIAIFVPALLGSIVGIANYFMATGDMRQAGYYMRKSKK